MCWTQAKVTQGVLEQFPGGWVKPTDVLYLEDILTQPCFNAYNEWWLSRGQQLSDSVLPDWHSLCDKASMAAQQGDQRRGFGTKDCFPITHQR